MDAPAPAPAAGQPAPSQVEGPAATSSRPTTALVLGILGLICCQILGPVAWYLGSAELKAIKAGQSPAAGEGTAKAGMIIGIVGTVLLILTILWLFLLGGVAILGAMSEASR